MRNDRAHIKSSNIKFVHMIFIENDVLKPYKWLMEVSF